MRKPIDEKAKVYVNGQVGQSKVPQAKQNPNANNRAPVKE